MEYHLNIVLSVYFFNILEPFDFCVVKLSRKLLNYKFLKLDW